MSKKFWFLTKMSFLKKIKNKTFIIVNVLLCILLIGLSNLDSIIKYFGGDFNKVNNIMVVNNTPISYDTIKESFKSSKSIIDIDTNYKLKKETNEEKAKSKIKNDTDLLLVLNNKNEQIDVKLVTYGYINKNLYSIIENSINSINKLNVLNELNISKEDLNKLTQNVDIKRIYIEKDKNENDENKDFIMNVVTPIIILPFFMLTVLVVQMIGAEINEEKSTRSMEVIISNVSPNVHFFSKVLAVNSFVILQSLLLLLYGFIGIKLRGNVTSSSVTDMIGSIINSKDIINSLISIVPYTLIIMLITIVCYSILAGILASVTTNMEDFQQTQTPIMIISLAGFYLSLMSSMFDGSIFIRILSYIPFISAILSPCLFISGVVGIKDILLSILIMVLVLYLLVKYGLKVYKEGILNYSSSNLWKKIFKAIKN